MRNKSMLGRVLPVRLSILALAVFFCLVFNFGYSTKGMAEEPEYPLVDCGETIESPNSATQRRIFSVPLDYSQYGLEIKDHFYFDGSSRLVKINWEYLSSLPNLERSLEILVLAEDNVFYSMKTNSTEEIYVPEGGTIVLVKQVIKTFNEHYAIPTPPALFSASCPTDMVFQLKDADYVFANLNYTYWRPSIYDGSQSTGLGNFGLSAKVDFYDFRFWETHEYLDPLPEGLYRIKPEIQYSPGHVNAEFRLRIFTNTNQQSFYTFNPTDGDPNLLNDHELLWESDGVSPWKVSLDGIFVPHHLWQYIYFTGLEYEKIDE